MFKKAFGYDDSIVFYFDKQDNKYCAKGGGIPWRLNNPGLISSYSPIAREFKAIGSYKQYAIFSHLLTGNDAHRAWLISSKYFDSPLLELCKHYHPQNPEDFLKRLCVIASLSAKAKPRILSRQDFEGLLKAIQKLVGFTKESEGEFHQLPKIMARYCSRDRKIERFLVGYEDLLTAQEAFEWVETHRLDAVIVHKNNGTTYLRSRPGHHYDQIYLADEQYGTDKEFENAIRDTGQKQEGQCIWGYVNGIFTFPARAEQCAALVEKYAKGQQVWSLVNDARFENLWTLTEVFQQKFNLGRKAVEKGVRFLKFLVDLSNRDSFHPPVVIFAHSQGALIIDLALDRLSEDERNRIYVFTFGAAKFISPGKAHPLSHNYLSVMDPVPMFFSKDTYRFLLSLHEGKKRGVIPAEIIQECIKQDLISDHQEFPVLGTYLQLQKERQLHYESELAETQNITILEDTKSSSWEHSFDLPCYQTKIQEIIELFCKNGVKNGS